MKKGIMIFFCLFLIAALAACGSQQDNGNNQVETPPPAGTEDGANNGAEAGGEEAETIYRQHCLACHGDNMEGRGGNTNISKVGSRLSKEEIVSTITNGGNGMPGFGGQLSDQEITTLADWLSEKK